MDHLLNMETDIIAPLCDLWIIVMLEDMNHRWRTFVKN